MNLKVNLRPKEQKEIETDIHHLVNSKRYVKGNFYAQPKTINGQYTITYQRISFRKTKSS